MWRTPAYFQEFLNQQGMIGIMYDAIQKDDLSDAVIIALDLLKKTSNISSLVKDTKCKVKSSTYRQLGNRAYKSGMYQQALENYHKALMYAPHGSEELVFAYSNRSALLATCKMYQACLNDIYTCFDLGCPTQITEKLTKRREEVIKNLWLEKMAARMRYSEFAEAYLQLNERRNPQISCASTDIGVIIENQIPKVVAIRDVNVGKVIAVEKAFVSQLVHTLKYAGCYYCHKLSLNLIPCDTCCRVLFCNKNCMRKCLDEYHAIECHFIELFDELEPASVSQLSTIAAIKLSKQFKSWEEFSEATLNVGLKRTKMSEINEIFDGKNKFSLLNFKDDGPFKYGKIYNAAFTSALVMHYLGHVSSFLPSRMSEKEAAIRGLCRVLMYFYVNLMHTQISSTVSIMSVAKIEFCNIASFGVFPFTGKLKGACNPNVLVLGLNNEVALVTVKPLKPGTELTIAYLGHWMDHNLTKDLRLRNMFTLYGTVCICAVCNGDYKILRQTAKPTETQLRCLKKLDVKNCIEKYSFQDLANLHPKCSKTLAFLSDLPYSNEYRDVFKLFKKCLIDIQNQYTDNYMLDQSSIE